MDAADKAGAKGVTDQAVRYIVTRPCLAEGSLSLLKYLQPHFPPEGELTLQDSRGEEFPVSIDAARGRIMGMGELYRAHNLGVNDVLMLSRQDERRYAVACVVKPHARSQAATERAAPAAPVTEKRVVIHATPHVREVRMERVTTTAPAVMTETVSTPAPAISQPAQLAQPAQPAVRAEEKVSEGWPAPAQAEGKSAADAQGTSAQGSGPVAPGNTLSSVRLTPTALIPAKSAPATSVPSASTPASLTSLTARLQQRPASPSSAGTALNTMGTPIQITFAVPQTPKPAPGQASPVQPSSSLQASVQVWPVGSQAPDSATRNSATQNPGPQRPVTPTPAALHGAPAQGPERSAATAQASPAPVVAPILTVAPVSTVATVPTVASASVPARGPLQTAATLTRPEIQASRPQDTKLQDQQHAPEDQLHTLARLTGYSCEHLGGGVVRLRAELGAQSYSVLIATSPQALSTPAWSESCDYMALLTPEDQRPQGIPRFTHAALEALLEHARLAPLTPIDLRGYWNTGSFDQESAASVAELVSAHLAQRGSFSHVLLTLAQQPAHSLVQLPRLAERLGSGVNTAELHSILETLTRPPFLALTPLPGGQYYLRSDVRELLREFGEYAEGMRRRLRPAVGATGR